MKKGNQAPRTRARWQTNQVDCGRQNCPCWCKVVSGSFAYLDPAHPLTTLFVFPFHMEPARWSYQTIDGSVYWRSTWNDGHYDGEWCFAQRASRDHTCFQQLWINLPLGDPTSGQFHLTSGTADVDEIWRGAFNYPAFDQHIIRQDLPWTFHTEHELKWMTYAETRAAGHDPDDTSPLTWHGNSGPP